MVQLVRQDLRDLLAQQVQPELLEPTVRTELMARLVRQDLRDLLDQQVQPDQLD